MGNQSNHNFGWSSNNSNETLDNHLDNSNHLIVEPDEDGYYYISYYPLSFELSHNEIDNIISNNIISLENHPAYEFVENALTSGVTGDEYAIEINLEFTRENEFLNIFYEGDLIAKIDIREKLPPEPEMISNLPKENNSNTPQVGGYIYLKNIGKRKIRYYKNGNKYVIVKGKKKKIK